MPCTQLNYYAARCAACYAAGCVSGCTKRSRRVRQFSLNGGLNSTSSTILAKRTPRVRQSSLSGTLNSTRSAILAQRTRRVHKSPNPARNAMGQRIKKQLLAQALSVINDSNAFWQILTLGLLRAMLDMKNARNNNETNTDFMPWG